MPRRLAQQTVSGVLQQLCLLGKGSKLGAERDAVAVEAVGGGGGFGQAGQQSGPLGDDWAMREWDEVVVSAMGGLLQLERREERQLH